MILTRDNYYSPEANAAYFSASQIKTFCECPARAMAEIRGEYVRPDTIDLLVGSYVDAYFDSPQEFERFKREHFNQIYTGGELQKNGKIKEIKLRAEFVKANEMIARAEADPVFMEYMRGEKQVIKTGYIHGYPFKIKMDVYLKYERIVDGKTTQDMEPKYKPGHGRVSFADFWDWPRQMSIYQKVEEHGLPTFLNVITKEKPPDIATIEIPQHTLDAEMAILAENLPYFDAIKTGIIDPPRCEHCAYCRATKKQTGPISLDDLIEF